ncbi:hypothetical protein SLA2020_372660 [Shorea laevis]
MRATIPKGFLRWVRCRRESGGKSTVTIEGKFVICHGPAWLSRFPVPIASVQIYSNTLDSSTGFGRISGRAFLRRGKTKTEHKEKRTTYKLKFEVVPEFGIPGAFLIKNRWCHEFFLESATLHYKSPVQKRFHFDCRSWVYPFKKTKIPRVFFSNTSYLPEETPEGLKKLREYELKCLRGELAEGPQPHERKKWDRVYEYAEYNDLGDPNRGPEYIRPVLGGKKHPYPRRLKTNRPLCKQDSLTESRPGTNDIGAYIPPDERLSPEKVKELKTNLIKAIVYFLLPVKESHLRPPFSLKEIIKWFKWMIKWFKGMIKSIGERRFLSWEEKSGFNQNRCLNDMFEIFSDKSRQPVRGWIKDKLKRWVPNDKFYKQIVCKQKICKPKLTMDLPLPSIIAVNKRAWRTDDEFGRQMVAGTNPVRIRRLQNLQDLPQDSKILKKKNKLNIEKHINHICGGYKQWILEELIKCLEVKNQQKGTPEEFDKDDEKILEELTKYWEKKKKSSYDADVDDERISEELTKFLGIKKTQKITIGDENKNLKIKNSQEITIEELSFLDIEEQPPNSEIETPTDKLEIEKHPNVDDVDERILGMVTKYLEVTKEGKITLEQIAELGHIFILDHQDHLRKYVSEVNRNSAGGVRAYASLTLLYRNFKNFKFIPVAIELSLSSQSHKLIVAPSHDMEQERSDYFNEWDLAKIHVAANDSAHHLLVSHWLHTHAVVEPFIIATRRRLSKMHPIYCLLDPHFKDTIHINALCRAFIINAGGILEKTLFTGSVSMEFSSEFYKEWRFNRQALPCDLAKRGMVDNVHKSNEQPQREAFHGDLVKSDLIEIVSISNEQPRSGALRGDLVRRNMVENVPILNEQPQREALYGDSIKSNMVENVPILNEQPQREALYGDSIKSNMVENVPILNEQPQREALHGDPVKSNMVENVPILNEQPQREALHGDSIKSNMVENVPILNEQPQREALPGDPVKSDIVKNVHILIEQPEKEALHCCDSDKRQTKPDEDPGPEVDCNYYPYASDGLSIWNAIERWVKGFCEVFYKSDDCVQKDEEIQQWWKEVQEKGHPDVCKGWDELTNLENLIKTLTTIIWIASALHAAVNFGGYAYALTRPMKCHEYIPGGSEEYDESFFLQMMPQREEMEIGMALMSFLSHHTSDEVYLGEREQQRERERERERLPTFWSDNTDVIKKFSIFTDELEEIQKEILKKNKSYKLAQHRSGAAKIPYKLLYPDISSGGIKGGITAKGIPNSISI